VEKHPEKFFHQVLELDLSKLEPHLVGPHTPDLARPLSEVAKAVAENAYPDRISVSLIGSCTNSSYEDISRAADVAVQAAEHGAKLAMPLLVSPGSEQIMATIQRDGQMGALERAGATVLSNACGPCIGQWKRDEIQKGEKNSIVTTFNRNFPGRNDANPETLAFIASREIVMANRPAAGSFDLRCDPPGRGRQEWKLEPPSRRRRCPEMGSSSRAKGTSRPRRTRTRSMWRCRRPANAWSA
jgi:aconitate hydratase